MTSPAWHTRSLRVAGVSMLALGGASCRVAPAMLEPGGPQAAQIAGLWWTFLYICAAVYGAVLLATLIAGWRWRAPPAAAPPVLPAAGAEPALRRAVVAASGLTVVLLLLLMAASFSVGRALSSVPEESELVVIDVTGHQWWWELRYDAVVPADIVTTANEMHVPLGRPIVLRLTSADVIHSFWAPSLTGKRDLIPGQTNTLRFQVDRAGVYRAPCAEFCGLQHARMTLTIVAEPQPRFAAWLAAQRQPAAPPRGAQAVRGQGVFLAAQCPMCHRVAGTDAGATTGPDLTHVGSRLTLAAGTLPNTRGHLAGWIVDPQGIKPGTKMPLNRIAAADIEPLLAYLEQLQ